MDLDRTVTVTNRSCTEVSTPQRQHGLAAGTDDIVLLIIVLES